MSVKALVLVACLLPVVSARRCYSDRQCPPTYSCVGHVRFPWIRFCKADPRTPLPTPLPAKKCVFDEECAAGEVCQTAVLPDNTCDTESRCVKRVPVGGACGEVEPWCKPNVCSENLVCLEGTCVRPTVTCQPWCKPGEPGCPCNINQICRLAKTSVTECSATIGLCVDRVGEGKSCGQWWAPCYTDQCQEGLECSKCGLEGGCEGIADAPLVCAPKEQ